MPKNLKLRHKLLLTFSMVLAFTMGGGVWGLLSLQHTLHELQQDSGRFTRIKSEATEVEAHLLKASNDWKSLLLRGSNPDALALHWKGYQTNNADAVAHLAGLRKAMLDAEVDASLVAALDGLEQARTAADATYQRALDAYKAGGADPWAAEKLAADVEKAPVEKVEALFDLIEGETQKHLQALEDAGAQATWVSEAVMAVALVLGLVVAWVFSGKLVAPLRAAVDFANRVAKGDLTGHMDVRGGDEVAELRHALRDMQSALSGLVSEVRGSANALSTASEQIAGANQDLSNRTERQAGALEETAASMEQMGATVRQNADSAETANRLAAEAASVAQRGGAVVSEVVHTMRGINESAGRIGDIIKVIDGIAFQTNILALNAAVEAARAGESGRGFAVVAAEVRQLAQRSAGAAKEIRDLIDTSLQRVQQGSALVDDAGQTMAQVVTAVERVTALVAEITVANREQNEGVAEIAEAVASLDQTTQQNAALVEEMAAAADSLNQQAGGLVETVALFKLRAA